MGRWIFIPRNIFPASLARASRSCRLAAHGCAGHGRDARASGQKLNPNICHLNLNPGIELSFQFSLMMGEGPKLIFLAFPLIKMFKISNFHSE